MKQRGQKSAESHKVVDLALVARPRAPEDLIESEQTLWNEIVAARPADFFECASIPLLVEFCRTKTELDFTAKAFESFEEEWLKAADGLERYEKLVNMRSRAQSRLMQLATKMRLTQQSRYVPHAKSQRPNTKTGPKPWEAD